MRAGVRTVRCPRCGARVAWVPENPHRPFCSERCRTVDLGAWATEQYRVATAENATDAEEAAPSQ